MLPTQQPGVCVSSAPALSPNKSIKQRQRQRTLNEQLDLLDRQFCVEVDVQMANRMDSISVSTPTSKDFVRFFKLIFFGIAPLFLRTVFGHFFAGIFFLVFIGQALFPQFHLQKQRLGNQDLDSFEHATGK